MRTQLFAFVNLLGGALCVRGCYGTAAALQTVRSGMPEIRLPSPAAEEMPGLIDCPFTVRDRLPGLLR